MYSQGYKVPSARPPSFPAVLCGEIGREHKSENYSSCLRHGRTNHWAAVVSFEAWNMALGRSTFPIALEFKEIQRKNLLDYFARENKTWLGYIVGVKFIIPFQVGCSRSHVKICKCPHCICQGQETSNFHFAYHNTRWKVYYFSLDAKTFFRELRGSYRDRKWSKIRRE